VQVLRASRLGIELPVWLLLGLALAIRVALFLATSVNTHLALDPLDYNRIAHSIATGHGFGPTILPGAYGPSAYRPPVYPYFLAAIYWLSGRGINAARFAQAVLGTLPVALIGLIAWRLWGRRAGYAALALAAVATPLIVIGDTLESEWLLVVLELAALAAVLEQRRHPDGLRWAAVAGVLGGLAMLTRTNAVVLVVGLAVGVWTVLPRRSRSSWRAPATLIACSLIVLVPWTIRNAIVMHSFIPVSDETGYTMRGTYNNFSRTNSVFPGAWVNPELFVYEHHIPHLSETALNARLLHQSLRFIGDHAAYPLTVAYQNTIRLLGLTGPTWTEGSEEILGLSPHVAELEYYGFFVLAALALVGATTRAARAAPRFLWALAVLLWLSVVLVAGQTRFRAAVDPFIVLLAALGLVALGERAVGATRRRS
jgi:4-amino-4-deoxy-L-arabinose transferase-like glycosyltransferase